MVARKAKLAAFAMYCVETARTCGAKPVTFDLGFVREFQWGTYQGKRRRAWMGVEQAELPTAEGGLGVPNIRIELATMAAMAVGRRTSEHEHRESIGRRATGLDFGAANLRDTNTWLTAAVGIHRVANRRGRDPGSNVDTPDSG